MKKINIEGQNNRYLIKKVNKEEKKIINTNVIENTKLLDNHKYQNDILNIIYLNHCKDETEEIIYLKKNISKKMNSYIQQDKKQNRIDNDTPLILEEIYELLIENKMTCHYCNENVFIYYEKYRDNKQWTLERKDNKLPHFKNNCVIACLECNLQRRNKNMDNFKFTKKLIIHKN